MSTEKPPEQGQLVSVRQRRYVVTDVSDSVLPGSELDDATAQHLLTLSSVEDDALGEELQVLWELEPTACWPGTPGSTCSSAGWKPCKP